MNFEIKFIKPNVLFWFYAHGLNFILSLKEVHNLNCMYLYIFINLKVVYVQSFINFQFIFTNINVLASI